MGEQGVSLTTPKTLTEDLAYLLGAYKGDGVGGTEYKLGFTGNRKEEDLRKAIQKKFFRVFNHRITLLESKSRNGSFDLEKWSKPLKRWALKVGMSRESGTPQAILIGTRKQSIAYLKGLWDTDGTITNQGSICLGQKWSHVSTVREAQLLLADLGICSDIRKVTQKLKWEEISASCTKSSRLPFERTVQYSHWIY